MFTRGAETVRGARALFIFHLTLLTWWAFVQFYYRVVQRFVKGDPSFAMGIVSLALIFTALIVTTEFAQGRRGTASQSAARLAVVLAGVDLIAETLQFAPRLGFPAAFPSDASTSELLLRGFWATSEFTMRGAVFIALWRALPDVDSRLVRLFFALLAASFVATSISFARSMGPFREFFGALPFGALAAKLSLPICLLWLGLIVYLSRRAARAHQPAR